MMDVMKTTVFLTDLGLFAEFNELYAKAFGAHKPPVPPFKWRPSQGGPHRDRGHRAGALTAGKREG